MSRLDVRLTPVGVSVSVHDDPDRLADDPDAHAAFMDSWQRAIDRGEFCPTCGGEEIKGSREHWQCAECGDQWADPGVNP